VYKLAEGSLPAIDRLASTIPLSTSDSTLLPLLDLFDQLDLEDFEDAKLLDRVDTKYVLSVDDLADVLDAVRTDYGVLDIDGALLHSYENQYFDTFDRSLFRAHHNRDISRFKYRYRRYAGVDDVWFEVKHKTNKGRMEKSRVRVPRMSRSLSRAARRQVEAIGAHDPDQLIPTMSGAFRRISLRSLDSIERATIDVDLQFSMGRNTAATSRLVVAEVKQPRLDQQSPLVRALHTRGIRKSRFSKYCVGMLTVDSGLKHNAFKPLLRTVEDIEADGSFKPSP
jgi:hypothetical protein